MWSLGVVLYILLSGSFPFLDDENLFHQIQNAQYSVSGPEWTAISESAKHMVRSLLTLRPDQRINVLEASQHPWIRGEPSMKAAQNIPGSENNGSVTAATNSTRKNAPQKLSVKKSTDIKMKGTGTVNSRTKSSKKNGNSNGIGSNEVPHLEIFTQSSSARPAFGSCSWSYRGSQASQNSQNSQNSGYSQCMTSPYNGRRVIHSRTNSDAMHEDQNDDVTDDKLVNRIPIDGLSLFRMATGVKGMECPFSVPSSIPPTDPTPSKKAGRPRTKRSDIPSGKNEKDQSPGKEGVKAKNLDLESTVPVPVTVGRNGRSYSRPFTESTGNVPVLNAGCQGILTSNADSIPEHRDINVNIGDKKALLEGKSKNKNKNDNIKSVNTGRETHQVNNNDIFEDAIEEFNSDFEDLRSVNPHQTNHVIKSPKKKSIPRKNTGKTIAGNSMSRLKSTSSECFDGNRSVASTPCKKDGTGHGYIDSDNQFYISPSNSKIKQNDNETNNNSGDTDNSKDNTKDNKNNNNNNNNCMSSSKKRKKSDENNFDNDDKHDLSLSIVHDRILKKSRIVKICKIDMKNVTTEIRSIHEENEKIENNEETHREDRKKNEEEILHVDVIHRPEKEKKKYNIEIRTPVRDLSGPKNTPSSSNSSRSNEKEKEKVENIVKDNVDEDVSVIQRSLPSSPVTTSSSSSTSTSSSFDVPEKSIINDASSSTLKGGNSKKTDSAPASPSVTICEKRRGVKRPWQSPAAHTDTDSTKSSMTTTTTTATTTTTTRESPKRKIQAISHDEKVKPTISASKSKSTNKKIVHVTGKAPQNVFRGTLEEAWGRSKVLVPPDTAKELNGTGSACTVRVPIETGGSIPGSGYLTRSASVLQTSSVDPAKESKAPAGDFSVTVTVTVEPVEDRNGSSRGVEKLNITSSSPSSSSSPSVVSSAAQAVTGTGTGSGSGGVRRTGTGTKTGAGAGTGTGSGGVRRSGTGTGTKTGTGAGAEAGTGTGAVTRTGTGTETGAGTGAVAGRRKLRVAMKSLVEIFQPGPVTVHREKS
jgi:Protein kinase domain